MAYISEDSIIEVQRASDIYEVISSYINLKRAGSNYKALCPFHDEKTPSFMVSPSKQMYKCFGCQKAGNVIGFVMDYEKVDFPEAVKVLAEKTGVKLKWKGDAGKSGVEKADLYKVNDWASNYFYKNLLTLPQAKAARAYLKERGVNEDTVKTFRLGYSLESWDDLLAYAKTEGYKPEVLTAASLVQKRRDKEGYYDYFRGRLMFPIFDTRNKVVGFGARTLKEEESKYINSPETHIFSKGATFYGLNLSKEYVEEQQRVCIVEGYFDVILPYQEGVKGLVATLGTALTNQHLRVLRQYSKKIILIYDADAAGKKASERSLDMLLNEDVDIAVARLPKGNDPCDFAKKYGEKKLIEIIDKSVDIFTFLLESITSNVDISTAIGKTKVIEEMLVRIGAIPNAIKREILMQQVASHFSVDSKTLRAKVNISSHSKMTDSVQPLSLQERREMELIELMLFDNSLIAEVEKKVGFDNFKTRAKEIARRIYTLYKKFGNAKVEELMCLLEETEIINIVAEIWDKGPKGKMFKERLNEICDAIKRDEKVKRITELNEKFREAVTGGDKKQLEKLAKEKVAIWNS